VAGPIRRPPVPLCDSRIDSVVTPGPWHDAALVRLAGSDDERPMGFPAQYAERIAKIGDKPLR